jgi:hypothetical protein
MAISAAFVALFNVASAEPIALDFQPPAEVSLFESLRFVDGKGKVKDGTCQDALVAAKADAVTAAQKKEHATIVAMYNGGERKSWARVTEVACEVKGKFSEVKVEALAIREGTDPAFPRITSDRVLEIADVVVNETAMVQLQLQGFNLEPYKGGVYYQALGLKREEAFAEKQNRNTRAVIVYREAITPNMTALATRIQGVPEISGFHVSVVASHLNKKGEPETEVYHLYAPTDAALGFANGDLTEQELIERGAFLYADGTAPPVKMDISFVDARD